MARQLLSGRLKRDLYLRLAKQRLLALAPRAEELLEPTSRRELFVYLGYAHDLLGERKAAAQWFARALTVPGSSRWMRKLALHGTLRTVRQVPFLDRAAPPPKPGYWRDHIVALVNRGFITARRPWSLVPSQTLDPAARQESFETFWQAIARVYPFFKHKGIDWIAVRTRYRERLRGVKDAGGFYDLMRRLVRELRDAHCWLSNYGKRPRLPRWSPGLRVRKIQGQAIVTRVLPRSPAARRGIVPGTRILTVDGLAVPKRIAAIRPLLWVHSSERAFQETAHKMLLNGPPGSAVTLTIQLPGRSGARSITLRRWRRIFWDTLPPAFPVTRTSRIHYGRHPSGYGYIRFLKFYGQKKLKQEFEQALAALRSTPGLIIDLRDNPGGFGHYMAHMVGRLMSRPAPVCYSRRWVGGPPGRLVSRPLRFRPHGAWQYTGPVALVTNTATGSASDLFACYLTSARRVITVGTPTHGNLPGHSMWVVLPYGLVTRISSGYVVRPNGTPIEGNGTVPQIRAERTRDDVIQGTDSVLDRAVDALKKAQGTP
ncbi:MAG: S41 family peptidase [bacterium]